MLFMLHPPFPLLDKPNTQDMLYMLYIMHPHSLQSGRFLKYYNTMCMMVYLFDPRSMMEALTFPSSDLSVLL